MTKLAKTQPESTALATVQPMFTAAQEAMIRDSFANGASREEFQVLLEIAKLRKLNPLLKQIHFVKRWDGVKKREVWSSQVSIDGLRAIAERTGKYDGQDEPEYGPTNNDGYPQWARVKIYRKDWTRPAIGMAYWSEYVQVTREGKVTRFWDTMPHTMLAKCAESLAMRKAFPEDMSGLYTAEEMMQSENERLPQISPHMNSDEEPGDVQGDGCFAGFMTALEALESDVDACYNYDDALVIRSNLGSKAKPSELNRSIQRAGEGNRLSINERKELSKIWQRTDRKLAKLETKLAPDAAASFADDEEQPE